MTRLLLSTDTFIQVNNKSDDNVGNHFVLVADSLQMSISNRESSRKRKDSAVE